jgi:hypothetical protein
LTIAKRYYSVLPTLSVSRQVGRRYSEAQGTLPIYYSPFRHYPAIICKQIKAGPFDLHVLATPPAFVLSQDQTLQIGSSNPPSHKATADIVSKRAQHFGIRTESAELKLVPRLRGDKFKLAAIGRIQLQKLHFRCFYGLTVNLLKSRKD